MTERRRSRHKILVNDLKEMRRYWKLNEKTVQSAVWQKNVLVDAKEFFETN